MSNITYKAIQNHNLKSPHCSLRLRTNSEGKLIIGINYKLYAKGYFVVIQEFTGIGFSKDDAEFLASRRGYTGDMARKLVKEYERAFTLKPVQEFKLFEKDAEESRVDFNRYMSKHKKKMPHLTNFNIYPPWVLEVFLDFWFAGDLNTKTEEMLFSGLKVAYNEDNIKFFSNLMYNHKLWSQFGVPIERMKWRCIYIREHETEHLETKSNSLYSKETVEDIFVQNPQAPCIEGLHYDPRSDEIDLILQKNFNKKFSDDLNQSSISINDLVFCLKILNDKKIEHKCLGISFAVDPENPTDDFSDMKVVAYPDVLEEQNILTGTEVFDNLYEALSVLQRIAHGEYKIVEKIQNLDLRELEVPKELHYLGLAGIHELFQKGPAAKFKMNSADESSHFLEFPEFLQKKQANPNRHTKTLFFDSKRNRLPPVASISVSNHINAFERYPLSPNEVKDLSTLKSNIIEPEISTSNLHEEILPNDINELKHVRTESKGILKKITSPTSTRSTERIRKIGFDIKPPELDLRDIRKGLKTNTGSRTILFGSPKKNQQNSREDFNTSNERTKTLPSDTSDFQRDMRSTASKFSNKFGRSKHLVLHMTRYWVVAEKVNTIENASKETGSLFLIGNPRLKVEAKCQKEFYAPKSSDENISKHEDQRNNFARAFTDIVPKLAKYYPCFWKLQQLIKAWAFAKWLLRNEVPIDQDLLDKYHYRHKVVYYNKQIQKAPLISKDKIISSGSKQQLILKKSSHGHPIVKVADQTFSETQSSDIKRSRLLEMKPDDKSLEFMGIMIDFDVNIFEQELSSFNDKMDHKKKELGIAQQLLYETKLLNKLRGRGNNNVADIINDSLKVEFPLLPKMECCKCQRILKLSETKCPLQGKFYCRIDHPMTCNYCFNILQPGQFVKLNGNMYHKECVVCGHCGGNITNLPTFQNKNYCVHIACHDEYLMSLQNIEISENVK